MASRLALRCRCGGIDVHTHVVPEVFPAYLGSRTDARWPTTVPAQPCHRHVLLGGEIYRTVSHQCWDPAVREADLLQQRLAHQVLSPMPELLSYWLAGDDGAVLCRFLNEAIAEMVRRAPERFTGLGAVPLQDVEQAVHELDRAVHEFGLAGVEIGSNVNGVPIGDPRFLPFFQAAERWDAAVFVHALRPSGLDRLVGPPLLEQALAFPVEVGLAAASMLTGGTLQACPGLRLAFSHGGGTLGQMLPRLQHAWQHFPVLSERMPRSPSELARTVFVDDLVYDAEAIRYLLAVFGPHGVMLGSDYPFAIRDPDPVGRLDGMQLEPHLRDALMRDNALRWLDGSPSAEARGEAPGTAATERPS